MRSSDASTNTAQTRTRSRYGWRRSNAQGAPMTTMLHLAQLNIGRIRHPLDDPRMADFVNNLDRVNAIAEHTPGFVWRLQDDSGNATAIHAFDDPRTLEHVGVGIGRSAGTFCVADGAQAYLRPPDRVVRAAGAAALRHVAGASGSSARCRGGQGPARASVGAWTERLCVRLGGRPFRPAMEHGAPRG